jgi:N-acetylglucosamine-6-phosphate deacetylase
MKLIETHVNGALGHTFANATAEQIVQIRRHLENNHHIGGFLASMVSLPKETYVKAIACIRRAVGGPGAKILGIHLEGPFLNPIRRGAHQEAYLRKPSVKEFAAYVKAADGLLKMITLAPELPGALEVIREARRAGVIVSVGHSDATYDDARRAFEAGATHVTHLFNAMRPFHQRSPGLIEAALVEPVYVEAIYDRVHISKSAMALVLKAKDRKKIILASDASGALDASDGEYDFDGIPTVIKGGKATVKGQGGLAGSATGLWQCYQNFREDFGGGLDLVTENPARLLGLSNAARSTRLSTGRV